MVGSEWLGAGGWCRRALVCVPKKKQYSPLVAVFFFFGVPVWASTSRVKFLVRIQVVCVCAKSFVCTCMRMKCMSVESLQKLISDLF